MTILWWLTKDGDKTCLAMYERHYSAYKYKDGRIRKLFCGPGEKIVLRTAAGDALWVWRKFIDKSGQQGINCSVFRRNAAVVSLSDRRMQLLIASGLVRGITPTSIRRKLGAVIPDFVSLLQDGENVVKQNLDC